MRDLTPGRHGNEKPSYGFIEKLHCRAGIGASCELHLCRGELRAKGQRL